MSRKHLLSGVLMALISFLALSMAIAMTPAQQSAITSDQAIFATLDFDHTQQAVERQTNRDQSTLIAQLWLTVDSQHIATLVATFTSTGTNTPNVFASPTQEILTTPFSATPTFQSATNSPTPTRSPTPIPNVTNTPGSPLPDANYTCRIVTTSALTRRITPAPSAQSLGIIPSGTTLLIHPYDGSIPFNTTFWYVRVADNSGGGWALWARIDPNVGTLEPRVSESYMTPVDPLCIPALLRS